jgi:hypothetical protein
MLVARLALALPACRTKPLALRVLAGYDAFGYIACTGTNFALRANALAHCGWFPTYTITEDFALGALPCPALPCTPSPPPTSRVGGYCSPSHNSARLPPSYTPDPHALARHQPRLPAPALTGIELKRLGYQAVYLKEYLAYGEAPEEMRNIFRQRSRWCKGQMQVGERAGQPCPPLPALPPANRLCRG